MKLFEDTIQRYLVQHLTEPNRILIEEFPFLSRVVDVVMYDELKDELTAIEIKVNKINSLVKQINFCKNFADKVFIALPKEKYSFTKYKELPNDIGIITFQKNKSSVSFEFEKYPIKSHICDFILARESRILLKRFAADKVIVNV